MSASRRRLRGATKRGSVRPPIESRIEVITRTTMRVLWQCPPQAKAALVLAHGAGAGMEHRSMQSIADALAACGVATLRFNFPFMEEGRKRVDSQPVATATIAAAVREAAARTDLPLWAGGHSFGGRMASHAAAEGQIDPRGLVFFSFPLHAAGRPGTERAGHLASIGRPMLFVSGNRDALADPSLLQSVVASLPNAEIHWLDTADHGYRVKKRDRQGEEDVFAELGRAASTFMIARS